MLQMHGVPLGWDAYDHWPAQRTGTLQRSCSDAGTYFLLWCCNPAFLKSKNPVSNKHFDNKHFDNKQVIFEDPISPRRMQI